MRMPLYRYGSDSLEAVERTSLAAANIRERQDLQRVLRQAIHVLSEDLLVVAEEYGLFEDSRRRVDLLALDRSGTLVVVELKRTDDGGHMELQALRYAAMVSTMTPDHLVSTYADANHLDPQEARRKISEWVGGPFDELPDQVRIILVSQDFSTEITSTVLWLNGTTTPISPATAWSRTSSAPRCSSTCSRSSRCPRPGTSRSSSGRRAPPTLRPGLGRVPVTTPAMTSPWETTRSVN